jgi:hypothetical protein
MVYQPLLEDFLSPPPYIAKKYKVPVMWAKGNNKDDEIR